MKILAIPLDHFPIKLPYMYGYFEVLPQPNGVGWAVMNKISKGSLAQGNLNKLVTLGFYTPFRKPFSQFRSAFKRSR